MKVRLDKEIYFWDTRDSEITLLYTRFIHFVIKTESQKKFQIRNKNYLFTFIILNYCSSCKIYMKKLEIKNKENLWKVLMIFIDFFFSVSRDSGSCCWGNYFWTRLDQDKTQSEEASIHWWNKLKTNFSHASHKTARQAFFKFRLFFIVMSTTLSS